LPAKQQEQQQSEWWHFVPFLVYASAIFFSKALVSVSVGLMAVWALILYVKNSGNRSDRFNGLGKPYVFLVLWFVLILFDGFRGDHSGWSQELLLKLPLVLVPLYMVRLITNHCHFENSWLFLVTVNSLVALITGINYLLNYDEINALLLQSKHIPVFGGMHHIYFGLFTALHIWVSLYFMRKGNKQIYWRINAVILFLMLHVLASRTGLVAFYVSGFVVLFIYAFKQKRYSFIAIGLIAGSLLPVIGYNVSTSFKNKVLNSLEDFQAVKSGKDINYKSLAMRVEAWKTSIDVIKKAPVMGVGAIHVDEALQDQYVEARTVLIKENRIGPHNQFLEITMAHGILGGIILLVLILFLYNRNPSNPWFIAMLTTMVASFFLESYLERQAGMLAFCTVCFSFGRILSFTGKETQN
jgi:O-antigen ligase